MLLFRVLFKSFLLIALQLVGFCLLGSSNLQDEATGVKGRRRACSTLQPELAELVANMLHL